MRELYNFIRSMAVVMCYGLAAVAHALPDQVALVINDEVVTSSELQKAKQRMQKSGLFASLNQKETQKKVIDYVINERIQLQQAKLLGLSVSDAELKQALQRIADANHVPLSALYQSVQQSGLSLHDYREEMKKRLLIQKLAGQHITKPPKITEQEISYFLKQYHLAQKQKNTTIAPTAYHMYDYLIPFDSAQTETTRDDVMKQAVLLRERMVHGKSLNGFPHEFQDLGMRADNELPDAFLRAAKKLKPNEYSPPIVADNGVHILKLTANNVSAAMTAPTSLTREQARQMVLEEKLNEIMRDWVHALRAQSYIEIK